MQALELHQDKLCIGEVAMKFGQVDVERYVTDKPEDGGGYGEECDGD